MLRKGCTGLLRQTLQFGLQQPVQQQSCVQLQVLSLQAVRFRSKPSACVVTACLCVWHALIAGLMQTLPAFLRFAAGQPKHRSTMNRGQKQSLMQQRALERALGVSVWCTAVLGGSCRYILRQQWRAASHCCSPVPACLHCPSYAPLWYCRGQRSVTARSICTRACASCGSSSSR